MTSTSDPLVGHVLDGRYQVLDRVARGGMATVYRATDTRLGRMVAVKVMHIGLGDDVDFARKFDREARSAARLSHPHVVSVFDQGDDSGRPYIVMELVEGRTLRSVISREAPLTPIRALSMIEPVLSALAAAHEAGLVHRDIKPENVLISERGEIKVGDFGLARAVTAQTSTATAGLLIGTVSYLPPELVISGKADARSDVYSTGVVMFELLTGRKPHTGESPIQVAYAHVHNDVPAPSTFQTAGPIPDYVDALIARATARNADARPHDAKVLLAQVRRVRSALQAGLRSDPELSQDLTVPLMALRQQQASAQEDEDEGDPYARTTAIGPALDAAAREERAELPAPGRPGLAPLRPAVDARQAAPYAEDEQEFTPTDIRVLSGPSTPAQLSSPGWQDSVTSQQSPLDDDFAEQDVERPRRPNQPVHRSRHRLRGWIVLILVLLLTAVAAAGGWYFAKGRFTSAPALTSMPQTQAKIIAREAGLAIGFQNDYSETVPKGNVIKTSPRPGGKILRGGEIDAVVSRGPERYPMPTVVGLTKNSAEDALDRRHLQTGTVDNSYSESVDKGLVLKASATSGDQLKPDSRIDLVVSAGPQPIKITDFTGQPAEQATAALKNAGFTVKIKNKHSAEVAVGAVIKQTPDRGEGHRQDRVTLVTSLGPVMVTVPTVKSMGVEAAKKTLEEKGFQVRTNKSGVLFLGLGYVAASDPAGGSKAPKGSTITLSLV